MKQLILGGARSGKSRLAEQRADASGLDVIYIATAQAGDAEMEARIAHHRASRPAHWMLIEEPLHLSAVLQQHAAPDRCLLVDCLTLWLTNLLLHEEAGLRAEVDAVCRCISDLPGELIMVSNEVGWGIVPMGELSRRFQDEAGRLHQQLAGRCNRVTLTVAGLPLEIKG
jgi:adenosylcobinamide kinase/adenosylcobinamide-phosphate guanylyltransferase